MFRQSVVSRNSSLCIAALSLLLLGSSSARAQPSADCEEALGVPGGAVSLGAGMTTTAQKRVDEWQSDIVKIIISQPGLLVLTGDDSGAQAALWTTDSSDSPRLVDDAEVGSASPPLTAVVRSGVQCVQVTPPAGATGTFRLQATLFDVCGGSQDDHGDSFLCATEIGLGETRTGTITAADHDIFTFVAAAATQVNLGLSTSADLSAGLYGEDGSLVAADARGLQTLAAGRYFVRIEGRNGAQGTYGLTLDSSSQ